MIGRSTVRRYKNTVIGIDPSSTKLAFTITSPQGEDFYIKHLSKDKVEGCGDAYQHTTEILRWFGYGRQVVVFCERQVGSPRGGYRALIPQAYVVGAIQAATSMYRAKFCWAQIGAWKKVVTQYGSASKELVGLALSSIWPTAYAAAQDFRQDDRQDIIDSAAINLYGRRWLRANGADSTSGSA